jgi:hypothetical protein
MRLALLLCILPTSTLVTMNCCFWLIRQKVHYYAISATLRVAFMWLGTKLMSNAEGSDQLLYEIHTGQSPLSFSFNNTSLVLSKPQCKATCVG